ncbi:MAG: HAMP domain-containing sensor histidine kinase [Acidimicrobiia bacterium]
MRRRLFWTIAGVAAVTGLLVLAGSAFASQRAAVEATYREMRQSSQEAVAIIEDTLERVERRPGAAQEVFRLLQGEQLGPLLGRIRRTAGGSDIAFAVIPATGDPRFSSDLFERVSFDQDILESGHTQFTRSSTGELVVITPTEISVRNTDVTLLVGLAREAPIVRLADQFRGMLVIIVGIGLLSALLARLLSRSVASRLEPLAVASRGLADGDLSARVPDLEDLELNEVASAFNEMAEELEASQIRERDFILGIGHDLRTPLTTIGGYAEALESGEFDPEDIERIGGVLGVQSRQLGRLIEDLSTLAQMEQPEFSLRIEPVDVGAHVKEVVEGFSRHAKEVGVTLSIEAAEGLVRETDPDRVGQIAQNLVENAMRYTPETGTVTVAVREEGPVCVIEVADTGIGIAPEDLPHIFDRHYVGKQRQLRNEGSGLGLSIVKGLVEQMGGEVSARSAPGKGTTITVSLPA